MLGQKITDRLLQRGLVVALGQRGGQPVEAQQITQHAQKTRIDQVAALRKHGVEVAAAPLQADLRHLH